MDLPDAEPPDSLSWAASMDACAVARTEREDQGVGAVDGSGGWR